MPVRYKVSGGQARTIPPGAGNFTGSEGQGPLHSPEQMVKGSGAEEHSVVLDLAHATRKRLPVA